MGEAVTASPRGVPAGDRRGRRLALLCEHFYPEMISTGMHMTELATRLTELGWHITVYTAKPAWGTDGDASDAGSKEIVYEGIRILRVPTIASQRGGLVSKTAAAVSFAVSVSFAVWRDRRSYDGMIITTNPPFIGVLGLLVTRLYRRPYLLIVYDVFPEFAISVGVLRPDSLLAKGWRRLTSAILSNAAVVVVIGRDMAELIRRKMPARRHDRIVLIPNWSDERRVRPVASEENAFRMEHALEGRFVVQYSGRLGAKHNLEPLIDAARMLSDTDVHFQFVGEGAKKPKLQEMVARYGLTNVQFLPYQPMDRLAETLSAGDISVVCLEMGHTGISVPSKAYGVMAAGTPILGMLDPLGEVAQTIKETGCGLLVDENPDDVASTIRELMADPDRIREMGDAARAAFLEKYTLTAAAASYDWALSCMIAERP
jgi:glycosyltransferase involved in cell wall biosynthesis